MCVCVCVYCCQVSLTWSADLSLTTFTTLNGFTFAFISMQQAAACQGEKEEFKEVRAAALGKCLILLLVIK